METETEARRRGIKAQSVELKDPKEFERIYARMVKEQAKAVILIRGSFTTLHHTRLLALALKHRLPSMCEAVGWASEGCLMSYGPEELYSWRRAAVFVDKILKGTKPADVPVEQPKKFELVINLKTAKEIGVTIPPNVLERADRESNRREPRGTRCEVRKTNEKHSLYCFRRFALVGLLFCRGAAAGRKDCPHRISSNRANAFGHAARRSFSPRTSRPRLDRGPEPRD